MNKTHYIYIIALLLLTGTALPLSAQTIKGTIYGGGQIAQVDGNTQVDIKTGDILKDVFGGGMGKLNDTDKTIVEASADVTGSTEVNIEGGTFAFPENGIDENVNHNVYGGGNYACKIGTIGSDGNLVAETGNTTVKIKIGLLEKGFMDGDPASAWGKWETAVKAQDDNVAQGSVFGGGYGVNTVVMGTAKVVVNVDESAARTAMVDVVGGGYNGYVLSNTDVTVEGMPEIYKIYGGGLGSHDGYTNAPTTARSHDNLKDSDGNKYTMQQTIGAVGENKKGDGTSLCIKGGKFYNNIFGGGAGLKYSNDGTISYQNVAEVFGKTNVTIDAIAGWTGADAKHTFGHNIYGGGALGLVNNEILVEVKSGTMAGAEIFAGSLGEKGHLDKAKVTASATVKTSANGSTPAGALRGYFNIYGGCDMAQMEGDTHVELQHGTFSGEIFGAGKGLPSEETSPGVWEEYMDYGKVTGNTSIVIDEPSLVLGQEDGYDAEGNIDDDHKVIKIYGGGALGLVGGIINPVTLRSGKIYGEVFGGSLGEKGHPDKAKVMIAEKDTYLGVITEPSTQNKIEDKPAALTGIIDIYGACDMAQFIGNAQVKVKHGDFSGRIFGGGKGLPTKLEGEPAVDVNRDYGKVIGTSWVEYDSDGTFTGSIYGGGALGLVEDPAEGSRPDGWTQPDHITQVYLMKGKILNGYVFGGSLGEKTNAEKAMINGNTYVTTEKQSSEPGAITGNINKLYGGGDMAQVNGNTAVFIDRGNFTGAIYGGGKGVDTEGENQYHEFGRVKGNSLVTINNGSLGVADGDKISIYGGGALGKVDGLANVIINAGTIYGDIYGASYGETTHPQKGISGSTLVEILGGTTTGDIYGGGALANVAGDTEVHLYGGSVNGDVYGGGLGDADTYEEVGGNATVILGKEEGRTNTERTATTEVKGSIFGANNVNGTPRGQVEVHVWTTKEQTEPTTSSYHVKAIYGGGNQSAYQPTEPDPENPSMKAKVIVEFCDNSIQDVYGGGNAAPVPGTDVIIYGGQIDRVFAGGNGLGTSDTPGADGYNPGADVGWLNYYSDGHVDGDAYGSGIAQATIYGGTINQVFGGSNTLGYIRKSANVAVENDGSSYGCDLNVGEVFGAGNRAPMDCDINITLNCTDGADVIYAGANQADVNGDIILTVASGTYNKVFGGNNISGNIRGSIKVNVDEYGCKPVIIRELYASSFQAPYSIYGYDEDGKIRENLDDLTPDAEGKYYDENGNELPYADPEINIISCTSIGSVFGGGYEAELVGSPTVNVNMIKGAFAGYSGDVLVTEYNHYGTDKDDIYLKNISIPNDIGTIGCIYGGGNMAAVKGSTKVNLCTSELINHLKPIVKDAVVQPNPKIQPYANITPAVIGITYETGKAVTGNVYGGGKKGDVYGNTKVHIRNGNIEGNVFGAGQGDAGHPDAALVKGRTEVIIGEAQQ